MDFRLPVARDSRPIGSSTVGWFISKADCSATTLPYLDIIEICMFAYGAIGLCPQRLTLLENGYVYCNAVWQRKCDEDTL